MFDALGHLALYAERFEAIQETVGELDQRYPEAISILNDFSEKPQIQTYRIIIMVDFTDILVVLAKL